MSNGSAGHQQSTRARQAGREAACAAAFDVGYVGRRPTRPLVYYYITRCLSDFMIFYPRGDGAYCRAAVGGVGCAPQAREPFLYWLRPPCIARSTGPVLLRKKSAFAPVARLCCSFGNAISTRPQPGRAAVRRESQNFSAPPPGGARPASRWPFATLHLRGALAALLDE